MNDCTCGTCSICRAKRKEAAGKDKPKKVQKHINRTPIKKKIVEKKPIVIEAMKGKNVQLKNSKRVLSEEEILAKTKEKERLKKEKDKLKRKAKRELITEKKLDQVFSQLVRNIYEPFCHACGKVGEPKDFHNCHLTSRVYRSVRWDLRNCYTGCPTCNLHDQTHVIKLYHKCEEFYGLDVAAELLTLSKLTITKLTSNDRKEMFNTFKKALDKVLEIRNSSLNSVEKTKQLDTIRLDVIKQTKFIV